MMTKLATAASFTCLLVACGEMRPMAGSAPSHVVDGDEDPADQSDGLSEPGDGAGGAGDVVTVSEGDTPPLPYPVRDPLRIKGIQPDFWPNKDELVGNQVGTVVTNLVWQEWEPTVHLEPCNAEEVLYDGHCFTVPALVDADIADWNARGVLVTAIIWGVPAWARIDACSPAFPGFEVFCAPKQAADYARFVGMLAQRYDGLHGHGRLVDFVIHNEANLNDWFDVGCGQGVPCDVEHWLDVYADNYNQAYDAVMQHQPFAKVFISLTHDFGEVFNFPTRDTLSSKTFLMSLVPRLQNRAWRVAFHPYPGNLLSPNFGPEDFPKVTFGNPGVLLGFLRQNFPTTPSAWEVHFTECGINSLTAQASEEMQSSQLCRAFYNILGTPGIESFIYHRMSDHPVEVANGLGLGLRRADGTAKPAWQTWALVNRADLQPAQLSCGFEHLPQIVLTRSYLPGRGHWTSSRWPPAGAVTESQFLLQRSPNSDTTELFECQKDTHNFITSDPACEGAFPLGPVGSSSRAAAPGLTELFRCQTFGGADDFVSTSPICEGQLLLGSLGFVQPL